MSKDEKDEITVEDFEKADEEITREEADQIVAETIAENEPPAVVKPYGNQPAIGAE